MGIFYLGSACHMCMVDVRCDIFIIKLLFKKVSDTLDVVNIPIIAEFWEYSLSISLPTAPFLPHTHRHTQNIISEFLKFKSTAMI